MSECTFIIISVIAIFIWDRLKLRQEISIIKSNLIPSRNATLIQFSSWVILPVLGLIVGWWAGKAAVNFQIRIIDFEVTKMIFVLLGLFIGISIAGFVSSLALLPLAPIEGPHALIHVLGWTAGFVIGLAGIIITSPFFILLMGMGCDVPSVEQGTSCVRGILYFGLMVPYLFAGTGGAAAYSIIFRMTGFEYKSIANRSNLKICVLMLVVWLFSSCLVLMYIPGDNAQLMLTDPLILFASFGILFQSVLIGFMAVINFMRIQNWEWGVYRSPHIGL